MKLNVRGITNSNIEKQTRESERERERKGQAESKSMQESRGEREQREKNKDVQGGDINKKLGPISPTRTSSRDH